MSNLYNEAFSEISERYGRYSENQQSMTKDLFKEKVMKTMETLIDSCNTIGSGDLVEEAMLEGIHKSHRYLQNEFFIHLFNVMRKFGKTEWKDARNEWSVKACGKASDSVWG